MKAESRRARPAQPGMCQHLKVKHSAAPHRHTQLQPLSLFAGTLLLGLLPKHEASAEDRVWYGPEGQQEGV